MRPWFNHRIVIHHRAAVDEGRAFHTGMGIDHRPLHDEAARPEGRAGAHHGGRMHNGRYGVPRLQQLIRPIQPHVAVPKGGHGGAVFFPLGAVIAAFPGHIRAFGRVVEKDHRPVAQHQRRFLDHLPKSARAEYQQAFHPVIPFRCMFL